MKINLLFITLISIFLFSCVSESNNNQEQDSVDIEKTDTSAVMIADSNEITYFVSTPAEIVEMLNEANLKYKPGLINDYKKTGTYLVQNAQAINLGVYTADISYCTYFEDLDNSANLFFGIQDLSDKLEIGNLLNHVKLNRLKKNLHNPDSVKVMAQEYNRSIYEHFIENNKKNLLALIATGGLVEGLYIALNSVDRIDSESPIARAIAEQKYPFEVLRDFVRQQKGDEVVASISSDIEKLDKVFSKILPKKNEKTKVENSNGKIVIGGSNNLTIDQSQYEELKKIVTEIRNTYISL